MFNIAGTVSSLLSLLSLSLWAAPPYTSILKVPDVLFCLYLPSSLLVYVYAQ